MSATCPYELDFDEMDAALQGIDIPPCPGTVTAVMTEAQKDAPDINVLTHIISGDVGMSAFTLKLANSTLFRRGSSTENVAQAVARLGTRNILCIVVAVALRNSMAGSLPADFLDRFWSSSNNTALASGIVARKLRGIPTDLAFTYGLFHDAAIPVLMRRFPDYAGIGKQVKAEGKTLPEVEDARYQCTHPIVGAMLARSWGLPKSLASAICFHHDSDIYELGPDVISAESLGLISATHVAEYLLVSINGETDAELDRLFARAVAYLGLDEDELRDLAEDISEAING
jgi:HD-like signal output (HDOD) protein